MVKEWDFEAVFFSKSKRIKYQNLLYVLLSLLAFFSVIHGVSLKKSGYKTPLIKSQFRNFTTSSHTISQLV